MSQTIQYERLSQVESDGSPVSPHSPHSPHSPPHSGSKVYKQGEKWRHLWRVINLIMSGFFLLATFVQINDPDPYIWMPVYLTAAVLTLSIVIKPEVTDNVYWRYASVIHMAICMSGALQLSLFVTHDMAGHIANPLRQEEGRELGGVVSIIVWLGICRFTSFGSTAPRKGSANALLLMAGMLGLLPLAAWTLCFVGGLHTKLGHCSGMFPGLLGSA